MAVFVAASLYITLPFNAPLLYQAGTPSVGGDITLMLLAPNPGQSAPLVGNDDAGFTAVTSTAGVAGKLVGDRVIGPDGRAYFIVMYITPLVAPGTTAWLMLQDATDLSLDPVRQLILSSLCQAVG